jgi:hypothetical protein
MVSVEELDDINMWIAPPPFRFIMLFPFALHELNCEVLMAMLETETKPEYSSEMPPPDRPAIESETILRVNRNVELDRVPDTNTLSDPPLYPAFDWLNEQS